jgi:REP element-mobilizing transposase RayT
MAQPIVIAHHLIFTAYGWWLPNDPRGSGSQSIYTDVLKQLGELHFGRKRVQPIGHVIRDFYAKAAALLQHPLLTFDENARSEIATAFADVVETQRYTCYACVIMPDHVHVLMRKHRDSAEEMIEHLKDASRARLAPAHRPAEHPTWGGGGWKVFLDHPDEVRRTIGYIRRNPLPLGLPEQHWLFVKEYDGWRSTRRRSTIRSRRSTRNSAQAGATPGRTTV